MIFGLVALYKLPLQQGVIIEKAHKTLCWFVLVGWAIYPIGYMVGSSEGQLASLMVLLTWMFEFLILVMQLTKLTFA